jgi:L-methionine (R)-S-oxide reductase
MAHSEPFPGMKGIRRITDVPAFTASNSRAWVKISPMPVADRVGEVRKDLSELAEAVPTAHHLMQKMVKLLHDRMLKYNWVGFYMLEPGAQPPMLVLGAFEGAMTPHTRIPLNQGICGAAASSGQTVVVDDVGKDPRYLACSLETKSEIVVPVFVHGKVVGELDIDSHFPAAFTPENQELVQYCAMLVGKKLETSGR